MSPQQHQAGVLGVDNLCLARQMGDQVGISGAQHQVVFTGAELDVGTFGHAEQGVGQNFAADNDFAAGAQSFKITSAFAVDKQDRIVFFKC